MWACEVNPYGLLCRILDVERGVVETWERRSHGPQTPRTTWHPQAAPTRNTAAAPAPHPGAMTGLLSSALLLLSLTSTLFLPPPEPASEAASPPTTGAITIPGSPEARDALWPLSPVPEVANPFDPPGRRWESGHRGVDLVGRSGQEVRAVLDGTISFAGQIAGRGVVVIHHGDRRTTYEPVQSTHAVGDAVQWGQVIGTLQVGPGHCAPWVCLHWGLIDGDEYEDPLSLLRAGPVRLLPLFSPWAGTSPHLDTLGRGR